MIRVIEGDTVESAGERLRLIAPEDPEISMPRCNAKIVKGLLASGRMRQLLKAPITVKRSGSGKGSLFPTSRARSPARSAPRIGARDRAGGSS